MELKNAWLSYSAAEKKELEALTCEYRDFLSNGKTERECVELSVEAAKKAGYLDINDVIKKKKKLKAGDKVYAVWMEKTVALFNIGTDNIENGLNILGAHIDSPRMDVKQNPLYEDSSFAYLDTHYYGGIKKYQWATIPLAMHGIVAKPNGERIWISVGEEENDPVFYITDLPPHLSRGGQDSRKLEEGIEAEELNIVAGTIPYDDEKVNEKVKLNILRILNEKYGILESDFLSSELEIVPAGKARDAGFDRSMILGYGHDDRVCAYPSMRAILEARNLKRTACCILVDKEEIGSVGATGMRSHFFENAVAELMNLTKEGYNDLSLRRCLANSCMLSSDVSAGFDPTYASSFEKKNAAFLGEGLVFNKFTGSRGKSGSNDANAEFIAEIRRAFEKDGIIYQTAELGKVDVGGGGTIAYILALYGMDVIDCGVPVLCMHAPWEVTSVADVYEAYKAYVAFISY